MLLFFTSYIIIMQCYFSCIIQKSSDVSDDFVLFHSNNSLTRKTE